MLLMTEGTPGSRDWGATIDPEQPWEHDLGRGDQAHDDETLDLPPARTDRRPLFIGETSHVGVGRAQWLREMAAELWAANEAGVPLSADDFLMQQQR